MTFHLSLIFLVRFGLLLENSCPLFSLYFVYLYFYLFPILVLRAGFGLIDQIPVHCLIYYFNSREWRSMHWIQRRRYDELSLKMCTRRDQPGFRQ